MATAWTLSPDRPVSRTWRNFQVALLLGVLALGLGGAIYVVETYVLGLRHRFVENPSDVMMRAFGLAHFWIGWLFLFTSPRLRSTWSCARLSLLTLAGAALCAFSWANGGMRNPLLLMAFYAYFLIHEIRDEANLFIASGEAPDDHRRDAFLRRLAASTTLTLVSLFVLVYIFHGRVQEKLEPIVADPDGLLFVLALGLVAVTGMSWLETSHWAARQGILWHAYRPLLAVYAAITVILTIGSLLGSAGFNLIVLVHVMAWLVFVRGRLGGQPQSPHTWWTWLRHTSAGFVVLHLAAAAVVLLLMALRVHLWERAGFVSALFATSSFHYWTIMHITMAYWKK